MSFILKVVRRSRGIGIRRYALSVKSQDPLVVLVSFLLERVDSLECKDGNCMG